MCWTRRSRPHRQGRPATKLAHPTVPQPSDLAEVDALFTAACVALAEALDGGK